jgi:serine phosphatase RsbU (regulator of sigma subunit)
MNAQTQHLKNIDEEFLDSIFNYFLPSFLATTEGEIYFLNDKALDILNKKQVKRLSDLNDLQILAAKNLQKINLILVSSNNADFPEILNKEILFLPTNFFNGKSEKLYLLVLSHCPQMSEYSNEPIQNIECPRRKYSINLGGNLNEKLYEGNFLIKKSMSQSIGQAVARNLLPRALPKVSQLSFSFFYEPCSCFGGDLFNILELTGNRLAIYIADVSGYGLLSTTLAMLFKNLMDKYSMQFESPAEILKTVNAAMSEILQVEDFVSTFFGILNLENFQLTYSNAGHPAPLLYSASKQSLMELDTDGFFLGVFPQGEYFERKIIFNPGDKLLLYTDGVIEAKNIQRRLFGKDRLRNIFKKTSCEDAPDHDIINEIYLDLSKYLAHSELDDDRMMVLIENNPFN